jgi:hypothetical protein
MSKPTLTARDLLADLHLKPNERRIVETLRGKYKVARRPAGAMVICPACGCVSVAESAL